MGDFKLHDFQTGLVDELRTSLRTNRRICLQLPTGGGKTIIAADMVRRAVQKDRRVLFLVHRQELVDQASRTMRMVGISPTRLIANSMIGVGATPVQVAMVQTLSRRVAELERRKLNPAGVPDIIIYDECHHLAAPTWLKLSAAFRRWNPQVAEIGLTATPRRPDGKGLSENFDQLVLGPSISWLIDNNYLSPFRVISTKSSLAEIRKMLKEKRNDFDAVSQSTAIRGKLSVIAGESIALYQKYLAGSKTIFFGADIDHSKETARLFRMAGISAAHLDGMTEIMQRRRIIDDFRSKKLQVLCNHSIVNEGFDVPEADGVILARHTKSEIFYLQSIGRVLRYVAGKTATIIDQAANWQDLGFPNDERGWSLEGVTQRRKGKPGAKRSNIRICRRCSSLYPVSVQICKQCNEPLVAAAEVHELDSEIEEVSRSDGEKKKISDLPKYRRKPLLMNRLAAVYRRGGDDEEKVAEGLKALGKELDYEPTWAMIKLKHWKQQKAAGKLR